MIKGIESGKAGFLLSIIGISNILGRIGLSTLSDLPFINRLYLYNSCVTICGISEGTIVNTNTEWLITPDTQAL